MGRSLAAMVTRRDSNVPKPQFATAFTLVMKLEDNRSAYPFRRWMCWLAR